MNWAILSKSYSDPEFQNRLMGNDSSKVKARRNKIIQENLMLMGLFWLGNRVIKSNLKINIELNSSLSRIRTLKYLFFGSMAYMFYDMNYNSFYDQKLFCTGRFYFVTVLYLLIVKLINEI